MSITERYIEELQRKRAEFMKKVEKLDSAINILCELNGEAPAEAKKPAGPKRRRPMNAGMHPNTLSMAFYHAKAIELIKEKRRPVTTGEIADAIVKAGVDDNPTRMGQRVYSSLYLDKSLVRVRGTGRSIAWAIRGTAPEAA